MPQSCGLRQAAAPGTGALHAAFGRGACCCASITSTTSTTSAKAAAEANVSHEHSQVTPLTPDQVDELLAPPTLKAWLAEREHLLLYGDPEVTRYREPTGIFPTTPTTEDAMHEQRRRMWLWINRVLSAADTYVWEPLEQRVPMLARLDTADWQSWIVHGLVALIGALVISLAPMISLPVASWIMVLYYLLREGSARAALGWDYKPLDGVMDCVGPVAVAVIITYWRKA